MLSRIFSLGASCFAGYLGYKIAKIEGDFARKEELKPSYKDLSTEKLVEIMQARFRITPPTQFTKDKLVNWYMTPDCEILKDDEDSNIIIETECNKIKTILFYRWFDQNSTGDDNPLV